MKYADMNWAAVVPMANEEEDFGSFYHAMAATLEVLPGGKVYFVVDRVSRDATLQLCRDCSQRDSRFITVWAPENRNLVDAYLRGFKEALDGGHKFIIEMDAGLSHDPAALPTFLRALSEGNECAFGSRYINGGSNHGSPLKRQFLSRVGTLLAHVCLGARLKDMTSGYQGFQAHIARKLVERKLRSTAHFYQTEVRYLLRHYRVIEVPIHYRAPSPRVSRSAIANSLKTLLFYTFKRFTFRSESL